MSVHRFPAKRDGENIEREKVGERQRLGAVNEVGRQCESAAATTNYQNK